MDAQATVKQMMKIDPLLWAYYSKLDIGNGGRYRLDGYKYHADFPWFKNSRHLVIKKGTQIGETLLWFLYAIHSCLHKRYDKNILYVMPKMKTVEMMSKVAFDPILRNNPWIQGKRHETDTTTCKQIKGRAIIFTGAQPQQVGGSGTKDSSNLRAVPCDLILRDERDLMDEDMADMSNQRLNASRFKHTVDFASPTIEGYGIDLLYEQSTQNKWQIKCRHCGKYTCLPERFPDTILQVDGRWRRSCIHCHKEIYVVDGSWQPDYKGKYYDGLWKDGLLSPVADLDDYMYRYHHLDPSKSAEFQRSVLGLAVTESDCQLSKMDVLDRCCSRGMVHFTNGTTCMGVDLGKTLHIVVGTKLSEDTYEILLVKECKDFGEIYDIAKSMNVRSCVLDAGPDIHAPKRFQKESEFQVWRCIYGSGLGEKWKNDGTVSVNRNEWCDNVLHSMQSDCTIRLPRRCREIEKFAEQMTKMARRTELSPKTNLPRSIWSKVGDKEDHYFHATLYFLLAATRVPPQSFLQRKLQTKAICEYSL